MSLLLLACARPEPLPTIPVPEPRAEEPPPAVEPPPPCERIAHIEVRKAERVLVASCERGARVTFGVALGREPLGPKLRIGDHRTPEGAYRISGPPRRSRFHLFLPIDYPSRGDVERARKNGVLSDAWYRRLVGALESGAPLPADSPLGGELGFHGEGDRWRGFSPDLDWTYGCIALADDEIDFIVERVTIGTPVLVVP